MAQLGDKFECDDCGIKVYDLGRPQALCPRCGRDLKTAQPKRKIEEAAPRAKPVAEPVVDEPLEDAAPEADEIDEDLAADEELELVEGEAAEEEEEEVDLDDEE